MIRNEKTVYRDATLAEPVEGFYLETTDGLFFAVKGVVHPPDRVIAILRYAPDPERGDRTRNGKIYRRLYRFAEQEQLIRTAYSQYLAHDPVSQTTLQSVPKSLVREVYDPRLRLRKLAQEPSRRDIEEDAVAFAGLLQREAVVPLSSLGVTGSVLIGLDAALSDLDIAVFGTQNCQKVYQALRRLLDTGSQAEVCRLDATGVEKLYAQRVTDTHMAFQDFVKMEMHKVNQGSFRGRTYFVRFIKGALEAGETYGDVRYYPLGRKEIKASIVDDQDAIFTPCRYPLSGACSLDGKPLPDLREIVSFRGRFCEQARAGETVMAAGTLERVQDNQGSMWHRLLLGNSPEDSLVAWR